MNCFPCCSSCDHEVIYLDREDSFLTESTNTRRCTHSYHANASSFKGIFNRHVRYAPLYLTTIASVVVGSFYFVKVTDLITKELLSGTEPDLQAKVLILAACITLFAVPFSMIGVFLMMILHFIQDCLRIKKVDS